MAEQQPGVLCMQNMYAINEQLRGSCCFDWLRHDRGYMLTQVPPWQLMLPRTAYVLKPLVFLISAP